MRQFFICPFILLMMHLGVAQEAKWRYDFLALSNINSPFTKNDLLITGAVQDGDGFIWIFGKDGILGYDGQSVFPFAEDLSPEFLFYTKYYHQTKLDIDHNFWIFGRQSGTIIINREGTSYSVFERPDILKKNKSFFSDGIFESDSILWLTSTDFGFHRYHLAHKSWEHFYPDAMPQEKPELSNGYLIRDPLEPNAFYYSHLNGIFNFNYEKRILNYYPLLNSFEKSRHGFLLPLTIFSGELLLGGHFGRGIERFNYNQKKWKDTKITFDIFDKIAPFVLSFFKYDDDKLILGLYSDNKMGVLERHADSSITSKLLEIPLHQNRPRYDQRIFRAENGSIHLIGQTGITRIIEDQNNFTYYRLTPPESDKNNWQRSFLQLEDPNQFLLGTYYGDGLIVVDWKEKSNHFISYKSGSSYFEYDVFMYALAYSNDHHIWIGTNEGMLKVDLQKNEIRSATEFSTHPILKNADIRFLYNEHNRLWISTFSNGVFLYDYETSQTMHIISDNNLLIHQIIQKKDFLWLATSIGVRKWNYIENEFIVDPFLDSLKLHATDILEIGDSLWVASRTRGLWNITFKSGNAFSATQHINPETPLLNFLHKLIHHTTKNEILMNTGAGYSTFNILTNTFVSYLLYDGIGFTGKNGSIFEMLTDGTVINGANRYFQYFDPDSLVKNLEKPKAYIKQLSANGDILKLNDVEIEDVHLAKGTDNISIKMGAVNYNLHPINYFSYRMKGLDENWSAWSTNDYINYSNLKGGNYKFEYRVANKIFEFGKSKAIPITINKKFYESWIFKILLVLVGLGILAILIQLRDRIRNRENLLKEEYQSQINELQMNALQLQMNPHFVFNSINSINYYIIKNERDKASNYLAKFSRLIRLILENSKQKLISLEKELEAIRLYLEIEQVRFEGKFKFEIVVDDSVNLSSTQIPPLIIQPYVENAIWHGLMHKENPGHLSITIKNANSNVKCVIEDDGIGREASMKIGTGRGRNKNSLGTKITKNRLEYVGKIYGIKTDIEFIDLKHMDGTAAGTRVIITSPKLNPEQK